MAEGKSLGIYQVRTQKEMIDLPDISSVEKYKALSPWLKPEELCCHSVPRCMLALSLHYLNIVHSYFFYSAVRSR